jgi:phosphatidylserine/phosphatidylglycerophosphate/cardiolipin synthase-like enzyme
VPPAPPPRDEFGGEPFSAQLATGQFQFFVVGQTSVYADPPEKMKAASADFVDTVSRRLVERLDEARKEVVLFSPYFIPESRMIERLRALRARGVSVRIVTNSLAVSDEPFANIGLERHQRELLSMGVELYELSADRVKVDSTLRTLLGSSIGRLHAKMAIVDRHVVYVGSMNLDGRSARINTEIGLRIESASVAGMLYRAFRIDEAVGVYRVKLLADGQTLAWSIRDADGNEVTLADEPDASWLHRLRVKLLSAFVPEGEL